MTEIPLGREFDSALSNFNRNSAAKLKKGFLIFMAEALATGTEPLVRRYLGERALPAAAIGSGAMLWVGSTLLSTVMAFVISSTFTNSGFMRLLSVVVPLLTGGAVFAFFCHCVRENSKSLKEIRASKRPYHSMSKGVPRFDTPRLNRQKNLVLLALLFLCPVVFVAYIASRATSSGLEKEQQRKLLANYYDRMDSEIQEQYLEDAIKGNVPPEITDLYRAFPREGCDDEMVSNIARANVGKPVSIVAQRARSAAEVNAAPGDVPDSPAATATQVTMAGPSVAKVVQPERPRQTPPISDGLRKQSAAIVSRLSKLHWRRIAGWIVVICVVGIFLNQLFKSSESGRAAGNVPASQAQTPTQPAPIQDIQQKPAVLVETQAEVRQPAPVKSGPTREELLAQVAAESKRAREEQLGRVRTNLLVEIRSAKISQQEAFQKLKVHCEESFSIIDQGLVQISRSKRPSIENTRRVNGESLTLLSQLHQGYAEQLDAFASNVSTNTTLSSVELEGTRREVMRLAENVGRHRDTFLVHFNSFIDAYNAAVEKKGFLFFR